MWEQWLADLFSNLLCPQLPTSIKNIINKKKKVSNSYPLDKAEANQLRSINAVLEVPQEDIIVETEDLLHVAKEEITLAVQVNGDQWLHFRVQHLILVALKTHIQRYCML